MQKVLEGVETLLTYPITQIYADISVETREKNGITETTLRLSIGIEDINDLVEELKEIFRKTEEELYG